MLSTERDGTALTLSPKHPKHPFYNSSIEETVVDYIWDEISLLGHLFQKVGSTQWPLTWFTCYVIYSIQQEQKYKNYPPRVDFTWTGEISVPIQKIR